MRSGCLVGGLAAACLFGAACNREKPAPTRGTPPPPVESASKPGLCSGGGGRVTDPASAAIFPQKTGGYCVDPNGETRVFGEGGKLSMDAICTEAFDGECEVYKGFGLKRVVQLRYVDGAGSPGTVEIYLSQFRTADGAYAMFTKRIVGDSDPLEAAPKPLEAGGAGAIGTGRAYVWRGTYLAELQYANEQETPEQMKVSSDRVLAPLSTEVGAKIPAPRDLPKPAAKLPTDELIPLGILYAPKDLLGIEGAGPGAMGFYRDGERRYRVVSILREDADQAKDVLRAVTRIRGASEEKNLGEAGVRVVLTDRDGAKLDWVFARVGPAVLGIGDDGFAVGPTTAPPEREKSCLSKEEKLARLKRLLK